MTDHTLSPDEVREIENGSAQAWASLTDAQRAEMASWGPGGTPGATGAKPAAAEPKATTAEPSTASEIVDATLTPEQRAAAEALLQPPARPQDYRLPDPPPGMDRLAREDDKMLREFFVGAELDQPEAHFAISELYRALREDQSIEASYLSASKARAELARIWGGDFEKKLNAANAEFARITSGRRDIAEAFTQTTLGNSVTLIRLLAQRAQRRSGAA